MTLKSPDPSPDTRERILDSAEQLFSQHGFGGTSVRQITEAAEANLGAVNYYFRSKEGLYAEVFARRGKLLSEPVIVAAGEAAALAAHNPGEAFRILGRAIVAPHEDPAAARRMLGLFAREALEPVLSPGLFGREFMLPIIEMISGVVKQARPDMSEETAHACAHAFFAQLIHAVKGVHATAMPIDVTIENTVRFTVAGIMHI
jgi:AcrR family transcriptional regulator